MPQQSFSRCEIEHLLDAIAELLRPEIKGHSQLNSLPPENDGGRLLSSFHCPLVVLFFFE